MKKELKQRIIKAIYNLDLKEKDIKNITPANIKKICKLAKCEIEDVFNFINMEVE